jgi:hypothetical protein
MSGKTPEILIPALRQYKHNNGSEGFVVAYDKKETESIIQSLQQQNAELRDFLVDIRAGLRPIRTNADNMISQIDEVLANQSEQGE